MYTVEMQEHVPESWCKEGMEGGRKGEREGGKVKKGGKRESGDIW